MKSFNLLFLAAALCLISCGGRTSSTKISNALDGGSSSLGESPWSSEPTSTPDDSQKKTVADNIQYLVTDIVAENDIEENSKKGRERSVEISRQITGSNGGSTTVSGSRTIATTTGTVYPITSKTNSTITFDGYESTAGFSLHGSTTYSGSTTITSRKNFTTTFSTKGEFSYKDSTSVYPVSTEMNVTLESIDGDITGTYTYNVNDKTFTGTFKRAF